jgi:hypothetical protein
VTDANRPEDQSKSETNDAVKPLVDEYVASIREPVGASDLFEEKLLDAPDTTKRDLAGHAQRMPPDGARTILVYLIGLVVVLITVMILAL